MARNTKNTELHALMDALEEELKNVQVRYEQYFLGLERREPAQLRDRLRQKLMAAKREFIRNTALKFKLNSLWNKYLSYERMWQRTVKEIEEGRYHRDVYKARIREQARKERDAGETAQRTRPAANGRPGDDGSLPDEKLEKLYNAFVTAKKRCKEDTSKLSMDAMRKSLSKQIPALKAKHKAKAVDFKVVIKNGKAILKAVPR